jgi:hypothetical protein
MVMKIDEIEKWIKDALDETAEELSESRWVQWKETALIVHPLYHHLEHLREKHSVDSGIVVIPEYRYTVPANAECKDHYYKEYERKGRAKSYDLAIVRFEKRIPSVDKLRDKQEDCNLWCFKPHPLIVFEAKEFKKLTDFRKKGFRAGFKRDLEKLEETFTWPKPPKEAYLCILYEESEEESSGKKPPEFKSNHIQIAEIVLDKDTNRYISHPFLSYEKWRKKRFLTSEPEKH